MHTHVLCYAYCIILFIFSNPVIKFKLTGVYTYIYICHKKKLNSFV